MKKVLPFLAILLALLLTFSSCAGCNQKTEEPTTAPTVPVETTVSPSEDPNQTEPTGPSDEPGVEIDQEFVDKAADMIYEFYKPGKTNTVSADFTLPSKVKYQGVDVDVEWVVVSGSEYAQIGESDYENLINVIVNKSSSGGPFTLKGIVKAGNYTKEIEFNYELVSQYDLLVAAYALKGDEKIENSTLTGVISKVNTPYDAGYGNITVTIIVDGHEDMPIMCYRLKGDGVDTIKVGDTITVFGTLVNYNGTIEFTSGCTLVSIDNVGEEIPDNSPVFNSDREIVNAAYKLPANEYMSQTKTYTLTGKVTKVNTPYDENYKNVTVTIVVDNMTDKPIQCYRMKGTDADKVKVTDVIQVNGYLKNYVNSSGKSTIEFDAGCTLDKIVEVGAGEPKVNYGTDQQIVDAAYALKEGDNLIGEQTLTGTVTKVNTPYDPNFQNVTVTIVVSGREDKPIQCYRMKGDQANIVKVTDVTAPLNYRMDYVQTGNWVGKPELEYATKDGDTGIVSVTPDEAPDVTGTGSWPTVLAFEKLNGFSPADGDEFVLFCEVRDNSSSATGAPTGHGIRADSSSTTNNPSLFVSKSATSSGNTDAVGDDEVGIVTDWSLKYTAPEPAPTLGRSSAPWQKLYVDEIHKIVVPSSTPASAKKFRITVDDSGTITATEVT